MPGPVFGTESHLLTIFFIFLLAGRGVRCELMEGGDGGGGASRGRFDLAAAAASVGGGERQPPKSCRKSTFGCVIWMDGALGPVRFASGIALLIMRAGQTSRLPPQVKSLGGPEGVCSLWSMCALSPVVRVKKGRGVVGRRRRAGLAAERGREERRDWARNAEERLEFGLIHLCLFFFMCGASRFFLYLG